MAALATSANQPCRRQGCLYSALPNQDYCCRLCSFNGKHGPACRKNLAIPEAAAVNQITLLCGGAERHALLFGQIPASVEPQPAIVALHGGAGNASTFQGHCGLNAVAQREGFIVAYPQGSSFGGFVANLLSHDMCAWNTAGLVVREAVADVDDVGFLDALIETLVRNHNADPSRIFMTGLSNGAMMAHAYATRCPMRIAAVAPVCGGMFSTAERPAVPVPMMMICGAKDTTVPMEGGITQSFLLRKKQTKPLLPAGEALAFWADVNQSEGTPQISTSHGGVVTTTRFASSVAGQAGCSAETILVVDANGGHEWPGGPHKRSATAAGTFSFFGAERVWEFFRDKRRVP